MGLDECEFLKAFSSEPKIKEGNWTQPVSETNVKTLSPLPVTVIVLLHKEDSKLTAV